jgi:hypothetical protein
VNFDLKAAVPSTQLRGGTKEMCRIVTDVENRPNHPWHKLLGDLTSEAFRRAY